MFVIKSISTNTKAYLFLIMTTSAWGSLYVVSKYVMEFVPPLTALMLRYLISGSILLPLLKFRQKKSGAQEKIDPKDYKVILLIGAVGYFGSVAAQMIGTKLSNAGLAALLNSLNPVCILLLSVPLLKEKITMPKIVSIITALIGVYIILGGGITGGAMIGGIASLISVVIWSLTSIYVKRIAKKYDPLTITTYAIVVAFICILPFSAYEIAVTPNIQFFRGGVLLGLLYMGVVCTAATNMLWNLSLSMIEAGRCALFYPIQPMVAALLGCLFLKETLQISFLIGAAFILFGVIFSVLSEQLSRQKQDMKLK